MKSLPEEPEKPLRDDCLAEVRVAHVFRTYTTRSSLSGKKQSENLTS